MEGLLRLKVSDVSALYCKLPAGTVHSIGQGRLHPQYMALREEGEAWAEARIAPVLSEVAMDKLRSTNCVELACYLWPNAEGVRGLTLVKFCYWNVLFDDVTDDPLAMGGNEERLRSFCAHFLHAMFGDGSPRPIEGFSDEELLAVDIGREWWQDATQGGDAETRMPARLQARVAEAVRGYVMAQPSCVELRAQWETWLERCSSTRGIAAAPPPCTLDQLTVLWRVASGAHLVVALTEYDLGIELGEESLSNPVLRKLIDTIGDQLTWVNNIYSFPKDILKHETLNFLTLLYLNHDVANANESLQATLAQAWDIAAQLERDCIDLATRIAHHSKSTTSNGTSQYANALCTFLASHLMWYAHNTRYPHTNNHPHQSEL